MQQIIVILLPLFSETILEYLLDPIELTTMDNLFGTVDRPDSSAL